GAQGSGAQLANASASAHDGPGHGPTCMATRAGQSSLTSAQMDVSRARTATAARGGSRRGHCDAVKVASGTAFPSSATEYVSPARRAEQPEPDQDGHSGSSSVPFTAAAEATGPLGPMTLTAPPSAGTDTLTRHTFAAASDPG